MRHSGKFGFDGRSAVKCHLVLLAALFVASVSTVLAQAPAEPPAPAQTESAPAVELAEVASTSENDLARLNEIDTELAAQSDLDAIRMALPSFRREIDIRMKESKKIIASRASLSSLRNLESDWLALRKTLSAWKRTLNELAEQSQELLSRVEQLEQRWSTTQDSLKNDANAPQAIRDRAKETLERIQRTRGDANRLRAQTLTLQDRVAGEDSRVGNEINAIRASRQAAMSRLLDKDSPGLWRAAQTNSTEALFREVDDSLRTQWAALKSYADRSAEAFGRHLLVFFVLFAVLEWISRQVRKWVKQEPDLAAYTKVFDIPLATAALLSLLLSAWIYPQAPRLWFAALSVLGLLPAALILRHLLRPALFPLLHGLIGFFVLDQLREITASVEWAARLLLFIEIIGGIGLMLYLLRDSRLHLVKEPATQKFWSVMRTGYYLSLGIFSLSLAGNIFGYVELANFLTTTILSSAYSALFIYALLRIADGLLLSALRLYPIGELRLVQNHRPLLRHRSLRVLQAAAWMLWLLDVLERLTLRAPLFAAAQDILGARSDLGSLHISLGDLFACALAIAAAVLVSRLVRFFLDEEVYPHLKLPRGVPYAMSRLLHYVILVIGFVIAIAAAGVDLTRFTILVSAFGVGVGFGLQQIINNFVSGIILLFERPVQVGDAVQIADIAGVIERIGIRASIVRLANGATVIVPNSSFITERITNRALTNPERSFEIRIGVAYGVEPQSVTSLLSEVARRHPHVSKSAPPEVFFSEFAQSGVYFTLRANVDDPAQLAQTKSELGIQINQLFSEGKLRAPATQEKVDTFVAS